MWTAVGLGSSTCPPTRERTSVACFRDDVGCDAARMLGLRRPRIAFGACGRDGALVAGTSVHGSSLVSWGSQGSVFKHRRPLVLTKMVNDGVGVGVNSLHKKVQHAPKNSLQAPLDIHPRHSPSASTLFMVFATVVVMLLLLSFTIFMTKSSCSSNVSLGGLRALAWRAPGRSER